MRLNRCWLMILIVLAGCTTRQPNAPLVKPAAEDSRRAERVTAGTTWSNNIVSEACFALSQNRSGSSRIAYQGNSMGDWPYPWQADCCGALGRVTDLMYGGDTSARGALGTWNGMQQGGQCKFFTNLVLYRSSYGYPGGHLFLPSGYAYANRSWHEAQPGWIIQAPAQNPHTAIVILNGGDWLDVIDANWIGGNGRYLISRHRLSAATLAAWGFQAYNPWAVPRLVG